MTWMKRTLLAIAGSLLVAGTAWGEGGSGPAPQPGQQPYWVEQLADGLKAPWSMAWLPDGDMLIVEKFGGLRLFHKGKLDPKPIAGVPVAYQGSIDGLLLRNPFLERGIALGLFEGRGHRWIGGILAAWTIGAENQLGFLVVHANPV